jgi:hypothetical protein
MTWNTIAAITPKTTAKIASSPSSLPTSNAGVSDGVVLAFSGHCAGGIVEPGAESNWLFARLVARAKTSSRVDWNPMTK